MTILESGWNLWVLLMGVVSRRWVWLVSVVVRRYIIDILIIIITFPYSIVLALFLAASSLFLCSFKKCFFILLYIIIMHYLNTQIFSYIYMYNHISTGQCSMAHTPLHLATSTEPAHNNHHSAATQSHWTAGHKPTSHIFSTTPAAAGQSDGTTTTKPVNDAENTYHFHCQNQHHIFQLEDQNLGKQGR